MGCVHLALFAASVALLIAFDIVWEMLALVDCVCLTAFSASRMFRR